jgi:two-component sensor histidine kinase
MQDKHGKILRWFGTCTEIHETKRNAEHTALLSHELSHRIKNIFAIIHSLISLSARRFPEAKVFAQDLKNRIAALGRAHDFARPHTEQSKPVLGKTTLHDLIREVLKPYPALEENRIILEGENFEIDDRSATPFALLFHELATNASKYGALSVENGRVNIKTYCDDHACTIEWKEFEGPFISGEPTKTGFGTTLSNVSVENHLEGQITWSWLNSGLFVNINCPKTNLRAKT